MLRLNNLLLGGTAQSLSLKYKDAANQGAGTSYTFSSLAFGPESTERQIVVGIGWTTTASATLSSATIGGIAVTIAVQTAAFNNGSALIIASVPAGVSGDVVLNMSHACATAAVAVYSILGRFTGLTPNATATDITSPTLDGTLAVPAGGFAIGSAIWGTTGAATWTGLTEDHESSFGFRHAVASGVFEAAQSSLAVEASVGTTSNASFVCASWGP